jgi:hypothetical protein
LCAGAAGAAAAPKAALLDLTQPPDPAWREQDQQLLERFRQALADQSGLQMLSGDQVAGFFREVPEAAAGPLVVRAREDLQRGRDFSERLKPDKAISHLANALRTLRAIFPFLEGLHEVEEAHLQLGMTYQALGKQREANEQYRMVLLLNPDRQLDEARVNPVVVERFDGVRQELLTSLKGSVSLISTPPGGRVLMDGRAVGTSPITIPGVLPGEHYFSLELDGYKTWFGVIRVPPGGMEKKEVFPTEGERIGWVRLRQRLAEGGMGAARGMDATQLAKGLEVDWLVLAQLSHMGGQTLLQIGLLGPGEAAVSPLGIFPVEVGRLGELAQRVGRWVKGDRQVAGPVVIHKPPVGPGPDVLPPPPPPLPPEVRPWYKTWWFWTAVSVVAASTTVTTALLLSRDSGIRVDVIR